MYTVKADDNILYYPGDAEAVLDNPIVNLQTGYAGEFQATVPVINPLYNIIKNRKTMITVYKGKKEIFYGEVRNYGKNKLKNKKLYCAGAMSFLADSVQPKAEYHKLSPRQMLEKWLDIHNSQVEDRKKIYIGIVTIHDSNDSIYRFTNREKTFTAIREKLVNKLGGHLRLRHENSKLYLDWITLDEYGKYCEQAIEFGSNLMEYSETLSADNVITCLIPLGARIEKENNESENEFEKLESRVDITSVNGGKDYIYNQDAVGAFGWIRDIQTWDDVTQPENLIKKGREYLETVQWEDLVLSLTALDLSLMDTQYDSFEIGDRISCSAKIYGMNQILPVMEMTIPLASPESSRLKLGKNMKLSYTNQNRENYQQIKEEFDNTRETTAWLQSAIDNATAMMTGSRGGYKVSEFDSDGRWLRDLFMNAPAKEKATQIMQFNMNGIGFSRDGFNGPYKNAWTIDGVLLGEFIKAGSISGEKLTVEYKTSVEKAITSKFEVAEGLINAEVKRATGQEAELSAAINVAYDRITQKVTAGEVNSLIDQRADSIRLKANRISWKSNYSSMSEAGVLDCRNANIQGGFLCGQWAPYRYYMLLEDGKLKGGYSEEEHGYIDYSAAARNITTGQLFHGIQIQGGCLRISVDEIATRSTSDVDAVAYVGWTGSFPVITGISDNGDGTITWQTQYLSFENGLMVTDMSNI